MRESLNARRCAICVSAGLALLAATALGETDAPGWIWQSQTTVGLRWFPNESADPRQDQADLTLSGQLEGFRDFGKHRFAMSARGRVDDRDSSRNLLDVTELYWRRRFSGGEILVGLNQEFWGTTEALHLVDILNQTDLAAGPDGEQKLGQPMIRLSVEPDWGRWDFYVLPLFRERTFPGRRGRLRGPVPIDADNARFESSRKEQHVDFALRYSHYVGPLEFALSHFSGTSRLPIFTLADGTPLIVAPEAIATLPPIALPTISPLYYLTDQTGLDATLVTGNWLWKLEAIRGRDPRGGFEAATGGFEITINNVAGTSVDAGLIVEYQYDSRPTDLLVTTNDDWVAGVRLSFNDFAGSELLLLSTRDSVTRAGVTSVEASRRFGSAWRGSLEARFFHSGNGLDALSLFENEDHVQLSLTRFF